MIGLTNPTKNPHDTLSSNGVYISTIIYYYIYPPSKVCFINLFGKNEGKKSSILKLLRNVNMFLDVVLPVYLRDITSLVPSLVPTKWSIHWSPVSGVNIFPVF